MDGTKTTFGKTHFGDAQLGDLRRTKRLVKIADQMARRPGGSLPRKLNQPSDLKAFYRLMDRPEVTHQAILDSHRNATLELIDDCNSPVLILHDGTELDFETHDSVHGELGNIGNGSRRGYLVQNSLAVNSKTGRVLGLTDQILHCRVDVPEDETVAQKRQRESRESLLWLRGTSRLPATRKLVDVCDQGADTFEFIDKEVHSGRRFVLRACYDRKITIGHDDQGGKHNGHLRTYARTLPVSGTWELKVTSCVKRKKARKKGQSPKKSKRRARIANMAVAYAPVLIHPPNTQRGNYGTDPVKVWVVRVWEVDPPEGEDRLEWFLITNEVVSDFEAAYRVVGWYEKRWIVEEFHKAKKTGCQIESPQFTHSSRLQPAIALISVVALKLLQMRDVSRQRGAKTQPASSIFCDQYVTMLCAWRHKQLKADWSIHDFYYALARLGGHQNRKQDSPPGWITIWRGWTELQAMVAGAAALEELRKCG